MAKLAVMNAVKARLAARFTLCPVFQPNKEASHPDDGSTFAVVQYPVSSTPWQDLPGRTYRDEGTIRFVVLSERDIGIDQAMVIIEELQFLFRGRRFDGVQVYAPSSPVIDDRNDNGKYFMVSFSVPYTFVYKDAGDLRT